MNISFLAEKLPYSQICGIKVGKFLKNGVIVRRASKSDKVVAGGGAIEMELSKYLRDYSRTIKGKEQMLINSYAKALEVNILIFIKEVFGQFV